MDYFWHITLPVTALTLGAFATLTLLTKNSFLDEIRKQYVLDRADEGPERAAGALRSCVPQRDDDRRRGLSRRLRQRLFRRLAADRDDLLARRPRPLSLRSVLNRDYPVVFANLYIFALLGLVVNLISDLTYTWIDPRIDFETREV